MRAWTIVQARRGYREAMEEVQRFTAAKYRLQGVIGKEAKLAEAEAALGWAQQGAEGAKQAYEAVCDRFLRDFERCVVCFAYLIDPSIHPFVSIRT